MESKFIYDKKMPSVFWQVHRQEFFQMIFLIIWVVVVKIPIERELNAVWELEHSLQRIIFMQKFSYSSWYK